MAIVPFRGLSEKGILCDPSPYQLDLNAWSAGFNVRFHGNKVMRAPCWRTVQDALPSPPRYCWGLRPTTGSDQLLTVSDDGHIRSLVSGTLTDLTPSTPMGVGTAPFTSTFSGDVTYINSANSVPLYLGPAGGNFATLPGWDSTWRAGALRAFGDYLIALNVTKGAVAIPNLVKWSDLTLAGLPPGSWNSNDSTTNAGENPLEDLDSPIVDGLPMRSIFVIYSQNQIWAMQPSPDSAVFTFQRLFSEGGVLSQNCVTEVDGRHYVFGPTDIYVHDGTSKSSIIDGRNREFVFRHLNTHAAAGAFCIYMPMLNDILFAYPSNSGSEKFPFVSSTFCNRGAVYSVTGDTWSFVDLPNLAAAALLNTDNILTYATCPAAVTYNSIGGSYADQANSYVQNVVAASRSQFGFLTNSRILAYDFINKGQLSYPFCYEANALSYVQKTGIDLEQVGSDLSTYKTVRRMFPLVSIFAGVPLGIQLGSSNTPSGNVVWGPVIQFNPASQYKLDTRIGGRYLAVQFIEQSPVDYEIEGFDFDVSSGGAR